MRARRGRRGRRADVRAAVIGSAGEARRSAQAPTQMRSQREKRDSRCCRKGEEQPAVERRAAQARRRRPGSRAGSRGSIERAIAPEAARPGPCRPSQRVGDAVQHAQSIPDRLPSSDELCWLAAGGELEDPRRASPSLAGPPTRPRPQASKASLLASLPSASMPKDTSQRARRAETDTPRRRASVRWAPAPSARPPRAFAAAAAGGGART